jgi:hypothetical protein
MLMKLAVAGDAAGRHARVMHGHCSICSTLSTDEDYLPKRASSHGHEPPVLAGHVVAAQH